MNRIFKDGLGADTVHTPDHALVDICFVHGLGGSRVSTWTNGKVFWPYNLVPNDIPDARVITWGYAADVAHFLEPMSNERVKDHARTLSNDLSQLRTSFKTIGRPIIFVAHSLGGIICAKSLLDSGNYGSEAAKRVALHTGGLAFMGTPFEGSETAGWLNVFERISKATGVGNINKKLLDHLKQDSHELKILGEEFPEWLQGKPVRVTCFHEGVPTKVGLQDVTVVPRESAHIAGFKVIELHASHVGMCKFGDHEDPNYKRVCNELRAWVDEIKAASKSKEDSAGPPVQMSSTISGKNYGGTQTGYDNSHDSSQNKHNETTFNLPSKESDE